MADDLNDTINQSAQDPKQATVDGNSVVAHPLKDQIEADRYAKSNAAVKSTKRGFNVSQLKPPGTI